MEALAPIPVQECPLTRVTPAQESYDDPSRFGRIVELEKPNALTPETLVERCVKNEGYVAPELNDSLMLGHAGFGSIPEGVFDPYYNCRTLFFHANGLQQIENLDALQGLRCLYLMENCIREIQNVACFSELMVLNLSNNQISEVPANCLPHSLEQLTLSKNLIASVDDLSGIFECPKLNSVDVSYNDIGEAEKLIECWEHLPLDCLFLHHNPGIEKVKQYRKKVISAMPTLRFLDERPINDLERAGAEAWARGEDEMEAKRALWTKTEEEKRASFLNFRKIQAMSAKIGMERWEAEREERERKEKQEELKKLKRMQELEEEAAKNKENQDEQVKASRDPPEPKEPPPPVFIPHLASSELDELD